MVECSLPTALLFIASYYLYLVPADKTPFLICLLTDLPLRTCCFHVISPGSTIHTYVQHEKPQQNKKKQKQIQTTSIPTPPTLLTPTLQWIRNSHPSKHEDKHVAAAVTPTSQKMHHQHRHFQADKDDDAITVAATDDNRSSDKDHFADITVRHPFFLLHIITSLILMSSLVIL